MKQLYLVRHAKSDWTMEGLSDKARPLNSRGHNDAKKMARELKNKKIMPDLIISSPAIRAISTALIFAEILNFDLSKIVINKTLYESGVKEYVKCVSEIDRNIKTILLFGHNPVITAYANSLTTSFAEEMSTCCIAGIQSNTNDWNFFTNKTNQLIYYDYPKMHS